MRRSTVAVAAACALAVVSTHADEVRTDKGLTAVAGVKVGHHTLAERPTGCTVILPEGGATSGVMRYLEEKGVGYDMRIVKVPIVPAAILYDLGFGGKPTVRPTAECGYLAAKAATDRPVAEGNVGAGAGATVGKMAGPGRSMKAGIGTTSLTLPDGLTVAA